MAKGVDKKPTTDPLPDPPLHNLHVWQIQAFRDILLFAAVIGIFWIGYALRAVTVPLLVALLLAYLCEPLVRSMCRVKWITRIRAVIMIIAAGVLVLAVVIAIVLPLAVSQTTRFVRDIQDGRLRSNIAKLAEYVPDGYRSDFDDVLDLLPGDARAELAAEASTDDADPPAVDGSSEMDGSPETNASPAPAETVDTEALRRMIDERIAVQLDEGGPVGGDDRADLLGLARTGVRTITGVIGGVVGIGLLSFLIPFYFFFFSLYYLDVVEFGRQLIPKKNKTRTIELLEKMDRVVAGFVRGRIVISLIMGVMLAIGWMICGVPYALPLGLVVGVFCAVPYLGVIGVPAAVVLLFLDQLGGPAAQRMAWWGIILWPTLVFAIVQLIEGYVLTPAIAGKATNLDPVTILVAVLAGGSVLGVYGMLLAIPAAACGKILVTDVLMPRVNAWLKGEVKDPLPIDGS